MIVLEYLIIIVGIYLSIYVLYSVMLLLVDFLIKEKGYPMPESKMRFGIVIPAHNEELFLSRLLTSIKKQDYPSGLFDVIVIADNCTDKTAGVGTEMGALVLKKNDLDNAGKGQAIKYALENIDIKSYDAILIIDADSIVKNDLLRQLDIVIQNGGNIIQCYNGLANPEQSWFTRLLDVSRTIGNRIFHPAKQKLGLSSYLMGNGMCFSTKVLSKYGWDAFTVGEDWEYYAKLIKNGEIISYAGKAYVFHQESSSLRQATSQRMRWSGGRFAIAWDYGLGLFYRGLAERNLVKLDASLPLILPNPSLGINITVLFLVISVLLLITGSDVFNVLWFLCLMVIQLFIFIAGIFYTQNKLKKFLAIFIAPLFLIWKMCIDILSALGIGRKRWIRTERKL